MPHVIWRRRLRSLSLLGCWWALGTAALADVPRDVHIERAAEHLHRAIEPDGRFRYRVHAVTGDVERGRYNVLRHAGSLLALAEYHQRWRPDVAQVATVERGLDFLRRCCLAPADLGSEALAVWSPPELVGGARRYPVAKLGGAGLTLAALAQWRRVRPEAVNLEEMRALARHIVAQQRADGGFQSLHALQAGQHDPAWVSLYYPGEAALGLILLHGHDPEGGWLAPAVDALRHLAREREGRDDPPADHWALIATAHLLALPAQTVQAVLPEGLLWADDGPADLNVRHWLLAHARAIGRRMLAEQATAGQGCAAGAFTADGRTTPTATRLEGLTAMAPWWPPGAEREAFAAAVRDGVAFLRAAQWTHGPAVGGFSRVTPQCPALAAADPRAWEVRVDQVQHALAALMGATSMPQTASPTRSQKRWDQPGSATDVPSAMQGR
jgi:hypothetical protein